MAPHKHLTMGMVHDCGIYRASMTLGGKNTTTYQKLWRWHCEKWTLRVFWAGL